MAKRGENIYLRKDGRYEGRCIKGRTETGKIIYHSVYAHTLGACKQKLLALKVMYAQEVTGVKLYGTGKAHEFMDYWLHKVIKTTIKMSTFANYRLYLNKWLIPYLGSKQLANLEVIYQLTQWKNYQSQPHYFLMQSHTTHQARIGSTSFTLTHSGGQLALNRLLTYHQLF